MTKEELINKHAASGLSKMETGKLRRMLLTELLDNLVSPPTNVHDWLDKKKSKLDKAKLARAIGYNTQTHNLRQSFSDLIGEYESILKDKGIIIDVAKTNIEIRDETLTAFVVFLNERLDDPDYHWPRNLKGFLYRKGIWAYFLDIPPSEVKSLPSFFHNEQAVVDLLASVDVKISIEEVKSLDYEREAALDEMADTMNSRALSTMRQKLKEKTEEVIMLKEELESVKQELEQYKQRQKSMLKGGVAAFKAESIY